MQEAASIPASHLFLIQLWREGEAGSCSSWSGKVQTIPGSRTYIFRDWPCLIETLEAALGEIPADDGTSRGSEFRRPPGADAGLGAVGPAAVITLREITQENVRAIVGLKVAPVRCEKSVRALRALRSTTGVVMQYTCLGCLRYPLMTQPEAPQVSPQMGQVLRLSGHCRSHTADRPTDTVTQVRISPL